MLTNRQRAGLWRRTAGNSPALQEQFQTPRAKTDMDFTIQHFRYGTPVGVPDRAITMHAARIGAQARQEELQSSVAVIFGKTAGGDEKEVAVIDFPN